MKDESQGCAVSATGSDSQRTSVESTHRHADHFQPIDFDAEKRLNVPFGCCFSAENSICIITLKDMAS